MVGVAVVGPFAEAVRATTQPCTFLLIAPATIAVVTARSRWQALAAVVVAGVVGGWLLAGNWYVLDGWALRVSGIAVIALLAVLVWGPRSRVERLHDQRTQTALAGVVTFVATLWWRPCVGVELGDILNGAQDGIGGQLIPMSAYMLGAMVPVAGVALIHRVVEPSDRVVFGAAVVAFAVGAVVAGSIALGQHDDVVVTLTRWTLE
ncbi:MAG: hypothetical protein QNJ12_04805 [Ilumatobacter sp.]|uniref:hypothetical protein n=1 Tax=Ilumatobacter sp. TaxID=1967498 RepID=UPI0026137032|nr:hypothetical protein [Ilumatobacter sp.]MDJ0768087.1 hypothetical protein [Ilumatobacter sp.]